MPVLPASTAIVVTIGPCIDDTDFKTLETAIAYNAAGMSVDVIKNTGAAVTKVDVTPTSAGGTYGWVHKGNAVYEFEIPASNNQTLGTLAVVGVATGVLPFESPTYSMVKKQVFNSFVTGTDNFSVDVQEVDGSSGAATSLKSNIGNLNATITSRPSTSAVNQAVDDAFNTAIPTSPTAASINQRVQAMDLLTEAAGAGDLAAILTDTKELQSSGVKLSAQGKLDVNAEVDSAHNTVIPTSPVAGSINERVKAIDDKLPTGTISDFDEASNKVNLNSNQTTVTIKSTQTVGTIAASAITVSSIHTNAVNAIRDAVFTKTGITEGGTYNFTKITKIMLAMLAGKVRDKSGSSGVQEVLDAENASTVIAEITLGSATPYKSTTIS